MKITLLSLLTLLVLSFNISIADSKDDNSPKYNIELNYKQGVYNVYRFTENTEVNRIYDDSSGNKYSKTYTYYITIFAPDSKKPNEFFTVDVTIDSLDYKYEAGKKVVEHFSQDTEKMLPIDFQDYLFTMLPLNTQFELTYSPYGDVAKLESTYLNNIRKDYNKIPNKEKRSWMLDRVSERSLKFITDIPKGLYPNFKVREDTTWSSELNLYVGDFPFRDEVTTTFEGYNNREYHLKTTFDSLNVVQGSYILNDIGKVATIESGIATGTINTDLYTSGEINYMRSEIISEIKGKINRLSFTQIIETTLTWDLLERYKF